MAMTRVDCMAAASALLFLGLLGGESALVVAQRGLDSELPQHCDSFEHDIATVPGRRCEVLIAAYSELVDLDNARETAHDGRDENPFIDSRAYEAYFAEAYAALQPRLGSEREAAAPQTDTDMENR